MAVDCKTRFILGRSVVWTRAQAAICPLVRLIPIRSKPTMPNYVTTLRVSLVNHVAFLVVLMPLNVLYAYLFTVSIADSFTNNFSQITLRTL